jgi:glycerol kinase
MAHFLALDQGTTSSRTIVFDDTGNILASAQQEFTQHYPKPGLVEHNAEEIWESQLATIRKAMKRAKLDAGNIAGIGITNQRETTIVWDRKTGKPLSRAIVWQDRRTASMCDELKSQGHEEAVRSKTGLLLDPYFSGTKLRWLLDNVSGLREKAERGDACFGTVDSWLIYRLTGNEVHATDPSNASRTLLYNIHELDWDDELLAMLGVPRAMLPEVKPSAGAFGETDRGLLGGSIPIAGVAGDQQAALFGQACFDKGMAKNTYGTGSFIVLNTGETAVEGDGLLTTIAWQIHGKPPMYALEASIFITGAAVQWLRDGLGLIKTSAEVEDLAESVEDSGGVYFVPALAGLGAPHWDPYARGTIVGLTRGTTAAHIARATLEAIAYQVRDGIDAMKQSAHLDLKELRVDGGAAADDLLLQFQADMLDCPVLRPKVTETTALGAAALAMIGTGTLDMDGLRDRWQLDHRFEPRMDQAQRETLYRGWQRAVERSKRWVEA